MGDRADRYSRDADPPRDSRRPPTLGLLPKAETGISGLDDVTGGGFPRGRSTLVCGPSGCGKTLLAMEFLVRGATDFNEPGVFLAFEESAADLRANVASLGFDLAAMEADGKLKIDHVQLGGMEMEESGDWDLEGLFLRLGAAIDSVGAKRVAIDTIESLFGEFSNIATLRAELRRLFAWLNDRGVTSIITGERGDGHLTRHGIEEYVSDCVIVLDHRVTDQTSTRRLRVLKYRGSLHGTNEYPFLIGESGISVLPITTAGLSHNAKTERVSTGVPALDDMLGGGGLYEGSVTLVSGTSGTGKTTMAAQFCEATCRRGERAMFFSFEESESEIIRNMSSVGIDLGQWVEAGLLEFRFARPSLQGLEAHLFAVLNRVEDFDPAMVVIGPVSDLLGIGTRVEVSAMLTRQVDFLKSRGVTTLLTSLDSEERDPRTEQQVASLIDTWILLRSIEGNGEHNRVMRILKSRGMAHSNQIREFHLTDIGIELADIYVGPQGVLTGSARLAQEAKERADGTARLVDVAQLLAKLDRRREEVAAATAALWREFEGESATVSQLIDLGANGVDEGVGQREEQQRLRQASGVESSTVADARELDIGAS